MHFTSPHPPLDLPEVDVFSFFFRRNDLPFPKDTVIAKDSKDFSRRYTFQDAETQSLEFAAALKSTFNITKGDMIAIISPNDVDLVPVIFGVLALGAIVNPVNPMYTWQELSRQISNADVSLVVVHYAVIDKIKDSLAHAGVPTSKILLLGDRCEAQSGFQHWKSIKKIDSKLANQVKISPKDDVAFLLYSSGTTGVPKGVMLTHFSITSNLLQSMVADYGKIVNRDELAILPGIKNAPPSGDQSILAIPFFHIYGLGHVIIQNLYLGIPTIYMAAFDFERWCTIVQEEKISLTAVVTVTALRLIKDPRSSNYDFSSLRMLNVGGGVVSKEIKQALFDRFQLPSRGGYGQTETGACVVLNVYGRWHEDLSSNGYLLPNITAKFLALAEDGNDGNPDKLSKRPELAQGEVGELYVHCPSRFKGYWKNPVATKEVLDSDGWLRTGDIGYIDKSGKVFITDRAKEVIKYKGFQVAPAELEGTLAAHHLVEEVAVVGPWSDDLGTEIPVAYVVRKEGVSAVEPGDDQKIMKWLSGKVIHYKCVLAVKFVDSLPRNATGKVLRRTMKERAQKDFDGIKWPRKDRSKL